MTDGGRQGMAAELRTYVDIDDTADRSGRC